VRKVPRPKRAAETMLQRVISPYGAKDIGFFRKSVHTITLLPVRKILQITLYQKNGMVSSKKTKLATFFEYLPQRNDLNFKKI
jgi:hypothetical protein